MKSKRLYILTIFYIAVFAILFNLTYDEVDATALTTIIALVGFVFAFVTDFLIRIIMKKRGNNAEK
jgi:hypothetical protein